MLRSSLENENEARVVSANDFTQQEDFKMYIRFPDYGDFQCYDLGVGGILSQFVHEIYANFHKPSWQTLKYHLFVAKIPKKLSRERRNIAENDKKKGRFQTGMDVLQSIKNTHREYF